MNLPEQFYKENLENIFVYHYVEEMIANFSEFLKENLDDVNINQAEFPFLVRIRFKQKTTQKELVKMFKVSEGYTAKLLRKFEDAGYITRHENPSNRRVKIVELTPEGMKKTDELMEIINKWEDKVTKDLNREETRLLKELLLKIIK